MSNDPRAGDSTFKRSQWRLSTLLILMFGFAVIFGGVARMHSVVDMEVSFKSLPPNDDLLRGWFKNKYNVSSLTINRPSDQTLRIQFSRAFSTWDVPSPPWTELGHGPTNSFVFAQRQVVGWWIPIGLVIITFAGWISRTFHRLVLQFRRSKQAPTQAVAVADG